MIGRFDDEAAMATDAYIDLLLDTRRPVAVTPAHDQPLPAQLRSAIELLHDGLPRFHPSFVFEEQLAARLRNGLHDGPLADVLRFRIDPAPGLSRRVDRRVLISGAAIASGVSVAAVYAFRHAARRTRPEREVIA
jgi:hypothetical protein